MMKFLTSSGTTRNSTSITSEVRCRASWPVSERLRRWGLPRRLPRWQRSWSNSLDNGPAEQAGRFDDQHGNDESERDRQLQFIADAGNVGPGEILDDAD